jgi:hypothetical protein
LYFHQRVPARAFLYQWSHGQHLPGFIYLIPAWRVLGVGSGTHRSQARPLILMEGEHDRVRNQGRDAALGEKVTFQCGAKTMPDLAGQKIAYLGYCGLIDSAGVTRIAQAINAAVNQQYDRVYLCFTSR